MLDLLGRGIVDGSRPLHLQSHLRKSVTEEDLGLSRAGRSAPEPPAAALRDAIDLAGVASSEGFQVDNHPTPGATVVYGSAYGVFGHIATVRAVQGDRYEWWGSSWRRRWGEGGQPAYRQQLTVGGLMGRG